jgi:transposase
MSIMGTMEPKQPRARRSFTPAFKAEIVELCQRGDRSIGQVARDFDLTETAVRAWVRQAERDAGTPGDGGLTSAERQELSACAGRTNGYGRMWRSFERAAAILVTETR